MKTPTKVRRKPKDASVSPYFSRSSSTLKPSKHHDHDSFNPLNLAGPSSKVISDNDFEGDGLQSVHHIVMQFSAFCDEISNDSETVEHEDRSVSVQSEEDVVWWENEMKLLKDPVYCNLVCTYTALYLRLRKLKPSLIQEIVSPDPWKLLLAVMFLNKTAGKASIPIFWDVLARWPTPEALRNADKSDIIPLIRALGLQETCASRMIALSKAYLDDPPFPDVFRSPKSAKRVHMQMGDLGRKHYYPPTPISHLPGTGPYALDSYRIFCATSDEWKLVRPSDKELIRYLKWRWAYDEKMQWDPASGPTKIVDAEYLDRLCTMLLKV